MKRFTVFTSILSVSLVTIWAFFQAVPAPKHTDSPIQVYDSTGAMLKALNPNTKVITQPAYDATGAMLKAINPNTKASIPPVYDATGAMPDAINP
jgi:hypothetical protein